MEPQRQMKGWSGYLFACTSYNISIKTCRAIINCENVYHMPLNKDLEKERREFLDKFYSNTYCILINYLEMKRK